MNWELTTTNRMILKERLKASQTLSEYKARHPQKLARMQCETAKASMIVPYISPNYTAALSTLQSSNVRVSGERLTNTTFHFHREAIKLLKLKLNYQDHPTPLFKSSHSRARNTGWMGLDPICHANTSLLVPSYLNATQFQRPTSQLVSESSTKATSWTLMQLHTAWWREGKKAI